jgi:hypothetical protein
MLRDVLIAAQQQLGDAGNRLVLPSDQDGSADRRRRLYQCRFVTFRMVGVDPKTQFRRKRHHSLLRPQTFAVMSNARGVDGPRGRQACLGKMPVRWYEQSDQSTGALPPGRGVRASGFALPSGITPPLPSGFSAWRIAMILLVAMAASLRVVDGAQDFRPSPGRVMDANTIGNITQPSSCPQAAWHGFEAPDGVSLMTHYTAAAEHLTFAIDYRR